MPDSDIPDIPVRHVHIDPRRTHTHKTPPDAPAAIPTVISAPTSYKNTNGSCGQNTAAETGCCNACLQHCHIRHPLLSENETATTKSTFERAACGCQTPAPGTVICNSFNLLSAFSACSLPTRHPETACAHSTTATESRQKNWQKTVHTAISVSCSTPSPAGNSHSPAGNTVQGVHCSLVVLCCHTHPIYRTQRPTTGHYRDY